MSGQFSLKASSFSYDDPDGIVMVTIDFEGRADGFGRTLGTLRGTPADADEGTWRWTGVSFPDDGGSNVAIGAGTFRKTSAHTWQLDGSVDIADGGQLALSGQLNLLERAFSGHLG
jgi:hypothetical protein